ncbi:MAG: transglycosylase domain-containing protein [Akkermansia sp.]
MILDRKNPPSEPCTENRKRVSLQEVPPVFIDALLLREDNRFYDHGGVDWIGVGRAFCAGAQKPRRGFHPDDAACQNYI